MTTSAAINLWPPHPATVVVQMWGIRGVTIYCDVCKADTDHNTAGHDHWAGRHQQGTP
jgi:hypothetical protein